MEKLNTDYYFSLFKKREELFGMDSPQVKEFLVAFKYDSELNDRMEKYIEEKRCQIVQDVREDV